VNLSSVYGLISPPGQCAYSASKFAVRGFSNALRHELAGSPVGVTVVHPGGVATSIARNARIGTGASPDEIAHGRARAQKLLRLPPKRAGEIIVAGIERNAPRVLVGGDAKFVALLERLLPVNYQRVLERLTGR
jgi:short-subunit dehydrogenase